MPVRRRPLCAVQLLPGPLEDQSAQRCLGIEIYAHRDRKKIDT